MGFHEVTSHKKDGPDHSIRVVSGILLSDAVFVNFNHYIYKYLDSNAVYKKRKLLHQKRLQFFSLFFCYTESE